MSDVRRLCQWLVLSGLLMNGCNRSPTKDELVEQFVGRCQELEIGTKRRQSDAVEVLIKSIDALDRLPLSDSVETVLNIENVELDSQSLKRLSEKFTGTQHFGQCD